MDSMLAIDVETTEQMLVAYKQMLIEIRKPEIPEGDGTAQQRCILSKASALRKMSLGLNALALLIRRNITRATKREEVAVLVREIQDAGRIHAELEEYKRRLDILFNATAH